jgi:hypothetical protein
MYDWLTSNWVGYSNKVFREKSAAKPLTQRNVHRVQWSLGEIRECVFGTSQNVPGKSWGNLPAPAYWA